MEAGFLRNNRNNVELTRIHTSKKTKTPHITVRRFLYYYNALIYF